jgi:hypothetical protein
MQSNTTISANNRVLKIAVTRNKVTSEDLQRALELAIKHVGGGCNCGLTGFDLHFVGVDPALKELTTIPNIQGAFSLHE